MSAAETTVAPASPQAAPAVPRRRWRFQFSLRTLAIFMLLVGVGFGSLGRLIHRAREQSAKVATLRSFGVTIGYAGEFRIDDIGTVCFFEDVHPWWKRKLVNWCGEDFFASVQSLRAFGPPPVSQRDRREFWRLAASFPELRKLEVSESWFDPVGMARCRGKTSIKSFVLIHATPTNDDLTTIGTLTELRHLHLAGGFRRSPLLDDQAIASLDSLKDLRSLVFSGYRISDKSMSRIATHHKLQSLGLVNTQITDDGARSLATLTELRTLNLQGTHITDRTLANLSDLTQLKDLRLGKTAVSDEGLRHFRKFTELESLDVSETKVHGPGIAELHSLCKLQRLSLRKNPTTDDDLPYFEAVRQLERLDLGQSLVTDAGIMSFRPGPKVREIDISGPPVTDKGLMSLARFSQLRELSVDQSGITPEGIAEFKKLLPNVQFGRFATVTRAFRSVPLE